LVKRVYPGSRAAPVLDSDYLSGSSLSDLRLVDESAPSQTRISLIRLHVTTLTDTVNVNIVGDVAISLAKDVLWLHGLDIALITWSTACTWDVSMGIFTFYVGQPLMSFGDMAR
jgi:hypothetical protein